MKNEYCYDPCPQTRLTEIASALYALYWSLLLLLPVHLFATNVAFAYLPRIGPEWHWGIASAVVSAWQVVATVHRRPFWRWLGLALGAGFWAGVASCVAQGSHWHYGLPINTGCGVYGLTVLIDFAAMVMLSPYVLADLSMALGRLRRTIQRRSIQGRNIQRWRMQRRTSRRGNIQRGGD